MKFIDLQTQYELHKHSIDKAIMRVLAHGQYLFGPEIELLENKLASYVGVKHCITMSSGTTALQIALMALDIKQGDEVITTPFSFFATAEVIYLLGAKPVYVDIDPNTYLIDHTSIESVITQRTKAIIPVSLYGQCADMDVINEIASRYGISVIEDAAQSFGAIYKGKKSCALSEIACTSFFPSKPLGGYGDSGACFTNNDELAQRMRMMINHGQKNRYQHVMLGINGRMDTLQAAILLEKFSLFETELKSRQQIAKWYKEFLPENIVLPVILPHNEGVYAQYTIQLDDRDAIQKKLTECGIPTAVHYPIGLHQQEVVKHQHQEKLPNFPITERCAKRVLSLPFHPYLSKGSVQLICSVFRSH